MHLTIYSHLLTGECKEGQQQQTTNKKRITMSLIGTAIGTAMHNKNELNSLLKGRTPQQQSIIKYGCTAQIVGEF
jgi:hypothetical protein